MRKEEIIEALEHQEKMLRVLRKRLQQRELQDAQYGLNVPPEITLEISDLSERIRTHEAELKRLQSLLVEDQIPIAEAEYLALLAEAWDTPEGRLSIASLSNLELSRLRLAITPQRAYELECKIREALASEAFYKIHYDMFTYLDKTATFSKTQANFKIWGNEIQLNQSILQKFLDGLDNLDEKFQLLDKKLQRKLLNGTLLNQFSITYEQIQFSIKNDVISLKHLGRAICLDTSMAVNLFIKSLPHRKPKVKDVSHTHSVGMWESPLKEDESYLCSLLIGQPLLPLEIHRLKQELIEVNNIWLVQEETALFERFIESLKVAIQNWTEITD